MARYRNVEAILMRKDVQSFDEAARTAIKEERLQQMIALRSNHTNNTQPVCARQQPTTTAMNCVSRNRDNERKWYICGRTNHIA